MTPAEASDERVQALAGQARDQHVDQLGHGTPHPAEARLRGLATGRFLPRMSPSALRSRGGRHGGSRSDTSGGRPGPGRLLGQDQARHLPERQLDQRFRSRRNDTTAASGDMPSSMARPSPHFLDERPDWRASSHASTLTAYGADPNLRDQAAPRTWKGPRGGRRRHCHRSPPRRALGIRTPAVDEPRCGRLPEVLAGRTRP